MLRCLNPLQIAPGSEGANESKERSLLHTETLRSNLLLLLTSIIWGLAFVAQRVGMAHVGPFTFNGIRFALGAASLIPLALIMSRMQPAAIHSRSSAGRKELMAAGVLTGIALFCGASLQQVGLVYTTAGKAGFITGLYVVIVPLIGIFSHVKTKSWTWVGAVLAALGLYLLCVTEDFSIAWGDFLELVGAFFWAGHVLMIARFSPRMDPVLLSIFQFFTCSLLSLLTAMGFETIRLDGILQAGIPILYGGLCSVGIAYTLQVVAQKNAHPAHAAIILSLESAFAALGGWLMLDETLSLRGLTGCGLMLSAMMISQLGPLLSSKRGLAGKANL